MSEWSWDDDIPPVELDPVSAEALDNMCDQGYEDEMNMQRDDSFRNLSKVLKGLKDAKAAAENAEVGATVHCAQCNKAIVKNHYAKVFCSNQRTHGKHNCKDKYHNRVKGLTRALSGLEEHY